MDYSPGREPRDSNRRGQYRTPQEWQREDVIGSTLTNLLVYVVFRTKGHEAVIDDELRERLYPYIDGILRRQGAEALVIGGTTDHIQCPIRPGVFVRLSRGSVAPLELDLIGCYQDPGLTPGAIICGPFRAIVLTYEASIFPLKQFLFAMAVVV